MEPGTTNKTIKQVEFENWMDLAWVAAQTGSKELAKSYLSRASEVLGVES